MHDLISRQATIDAIEELKTRYFDRKVVLAKAQDAVNNVPSAQPERKRGEWINCTEDGYVECPFCHSATNCDGNKDELHFCFSCGADMRAKETDCDYERAVEQLEYDMLYEPTFNPDDGSM